MGNTLKYLNHYSPAIQQQVKDLLVQKKLKEHLIKQFPTTHNIKSDKALHQ
jgi:hypothetical protein